MTFTLKPIDQQVIVVFGASRGIGRTTALMAARRGAQVVAAARDLIVGGAAKATLLAQKVSLRLVDAFASVAGVFLQKSKQPKQPWDGDAVFEPPSGDHRERGEVTTTEPRGGTTS